MKPELLATLAVRLMGMWMLVQGVLALPQLLFWHRSATQGLHLHDTYYVAADLSAPVGAACAFGAGLILLATNRFFRRLLSRGLGTDHSNSA